MTEDDAGGPSSFATELEPPPDPPRRRHRWLTAPSGVVIFVCLFLPAVKVCNSPAYPYEAFGVQTPYLLGLFVAILALIRSPRAIARLVTAIRVVVWLTVAGWSVVMLWVLVDGTEVLAALAFAASATVVCLMFGKQRRDEAAAVRVTLATAAMCIVWFGLFCFDPGAMYGTYTGAVASVGLLVGGLEWRRECKRAVTAPVVARAELR